MALLQRNFKAAISLLNNAKSVKSNPSASHVLCNNNMQQHFFCCRLLQSLTTTSSSLLLSNSSIQQRTVCAAPSISVFYNNHSMSQTGLLTYRTAHTKSEGDQQFIEFLAAEIETEKADAPKQSLSISGFDIEHQGSDVKLTKRHQDETVTVEFNVNNSVESPSDAEEGILEGEQLNDPSEMISQPEFTVTLKKDGLTSMLCLQCSFVDSSLTKDVPEDEVDLFAIDEVAMVEGEWKDSTYSVNADILDPNMYDMLMLMLEERGINHTSFCDQLIQYSTEYERSIYIDMLQSMQNFVQK